MSAPALAVERGFVVAEGRFVVERLLSSALSVRSLLLDRASLKALQPALAGLSPGIPIYVTDRRVFEAVTGYDMHRGCLALATRPSLISVDTITRSPGILIALENCNNADNMGGVFRNAAAFAAAGVLLSPGCCDPFYRKSIRTSMGAVFGVPFARTGLCSPVCDDLKASGYTIAALTPSPSAIPLDVFATERRAGRLALFVGAEGDGLSPEILRHADACIRIPTTAAVDSLNLSVAMGIALARLSVLPVSDTR